MFNQLLSNKLAISLMIRASIRAQVPKNKGLKGSFDAAAIATIKRLILITSFGVLGARLVL